MATLKADKIATSRNANQYLIVQDGDDEIDCYSMIISVPAHKEAAFTAACSTKSFNVKEYGHMLHYSAGELSAEEAAKITKTLSA